MPAIPRYPPFVAAGAPGAPPVIADALPPIEQFLDDLPSILDFIDFEQAGDVDEFVETRDEPVAWTDAGPMESDAEGWAMSGWQSYDWSSVASLANSSAERALADREWGTTPWDGGHHGEMSAAAPAQLAGFPRAADMAPTADEVAAALDGIARRIRSGELVIESLHGMPPEAAMAAALAMLLRMRG